MSQSDGRNAHMNPRLKKIKKGRSQWRFSLFISDKSIRSLQAFSNLKKICEEWIPGQYEIEIIDLLARPELARQNNIVALPTLVRISPKPMRTVIGDLSDPEKAIMGLDLRLSA
jgi:circadian clock protein KaiB